MPGQKKCAVVEGEQSQWLMLIKDECVKSGKDGTKRPSFCKLRHPRTNTGAMFLFSEEDHKLFEVLQFKEDFRSWFIGQTVQEDGSLYITTPINPVFLMLHYLIKESEDGKFKPLDQIVVDEDYPECRRLSQCHAQQQLSKFTDIKGPDDLQVYKYNAEKSLAWLSSKVNQIADKLEERNIKGGAQAVTYVKSNKSDTKREDYVRYAHGILSEYLPLSLSADLKSHMGIKDPVVLHEKPQIDEPNAKRQKKDVAPTEDYSAGSNGTTASKTAPKLTKAQKALSKVDKKGMKSISSFFSPKAK